MDFSAAEAHHERAGADDDVTPTQGEVKVTLPAELESSRLARTFVRQSWPDLDSNVLDDVALIVTELVSNAVKHGAPELQLRLRRDPFAVDVAVLDHGADMPPTEVRQADLAATSGRGLFMVDQLANRWGCEPLVGETGKAVWASLTP